MLKSYAQFCPVAKTAEIIGTRWTLLIVRELCYGSKTFGDMLNGLISISRTTLSMRLKELSEAGILEVVSPEPGRHLYRLTSAGEGLRPMVELMSDWGRTHGQGSIKQEDLDPRALVWSIRRQIDPDAIARECVLRFDFRGLPKAQASHRRWWMVLRPQDIEICLRDPGHSTDVVIDADIARFVNVWLGEEGAATAEQEGALRLSGPAGAVQAVRAMLGLFDEPTRKNFRLSAFASAKGAEPVTG
jgi:DNA-binding HxlR family transcriptional regulator